VDADGNGVTPTVALDDVRLYSRALTDAEIASLHASNATISNGLRIRLPFD